MTVKAIVNIPSSETAREAGGVLHGSIQLTTTKPQENDLTLAVRFFGRSRADFLGSNTPMTKGIGNILGNQMEQPNDSQASVNVTLADEVVKLGAIKDIDEVEGTRTIPFSVRLPRALPSSYQASRKSVTSYIKYTLDVILIGSGQSDEKVIESVVVPILERVVVNTPSASGKTASHTEEKEIKVSKSLFSTSSTEKLSANIRVLKAEVMPGDEIPVEVEIDGPMFVLSDTIVTATLRRVYCLRSKISTYSDDVNEQTVSFKSTATSETGPLKQTLTLSVPKSIAPPTLTAPNQKVEYAVLVQVNPGKTSRWEDKLLFGSSVTVGTVKAEEIAKEE